MNATKFRSRVQTLPVRAHVKRHRACVIRSQQSAPVLVQADGTRYTIEKTTVLGSSPSSSQIVIHDKEIAPQHAKFEFKGGRLFCTALAAKDPDNMLSPTATWVEDIELRPGVAYMLSKNATLCFGTAGSNTLIAEFEESGGGGGAMADMLMKGMASQASKEVQERLNDLS